VIHTNSWNYSAVVILQRKEAKKFIVLTLCNEGEELEEVAKDLVNIEKHKAVSPHQSIKELFCPVGVIRHAVVEIDGQLIEYISEEVMSIEVNRIIEDYQRRQIPRFR
jgi:hypothetical protein